MQPTLIVACGALAPEILAVLGQQALSHLRLECLPAKLHNRPSLIPEAVRAKIRDARARGYERVAVAYADCGTGGQLDRVLEEEGAERIGGAHCYAFFAGQERFEALAEEEVGTFYLTDFLAKHFDTLVWRGLGLDRHPELKDLYFGHYKRLVHLAQVPDPATERASRDAAACLGLEHVYLHTGFGELEDFLVQVGEPPVDGAEHDRLLARHPGPGAGQAGAQGR